MDVVGKIRELLHELDKCISSCNKYDPGYGSEEYADEILASCHVACYDKFVKELRKVTE